jgi:hypothetical protein
MVMLIASAYARSDSPAKTVAAVLEVGPAQVPNLETKHKSDSPFVLKILGRLFVHKAL